MTAFRNKCGYTHWWPYRPRVISTKTSSCSRLYIWHIHFLTMIYISHNYNGHNNAIVCIQEHTYIVVCKFIGYGQFTLTYLEVLSVLINTFCLDITTLCMKSSSSKCKTAVFIFSIKATTCVVCKQYNLLPFVQYDFLNS